MSSEGKAHSMAKIAKEYGWSGSIDIDHEGDMATLTANRDGEWLEVVWVADQLNGPPKYSFNGQPSNLHSAAVAKRVLAGKPDVQAFMKRRRRQEATKGVPQITSSTAEEVKEDGPIEITQHQLPFEINVTPDNKILKEIRGSTLIWYNSISGTAESCRVPVDKNRDLENVFFIAESSKGRAYVSFMDSNGVFRAVGLDAILQVR